MGGITGLTPDYTGVNGDIDSDPFGGDNDAGADNEPRQAQAAQLSAPQATAAPPIHPYIAAQLAGLTAPSQAPPPAPAGGSHDASAAAKALEQYKKPGGSQDAGAAAKALEQYKHTGAPTADNYHVTNATPQDIAKLNLALQYLNQSSTGKDITVAAENAHGKPLTINIIHNGNDNYDPATNTVNWDPNSSLVVTNDSGHGKPSGEQSAALGLVHEMAHATDPHPQSYQSKPNPQYDTNAEQYAVGKEDLVAKDLGEPMRDNHAGIPTVEKNPTEHTNPNHQWVSDTNTDGKLVEHNDGSYTPGTSPNPP